MTLDADLIFNGKVLASRRFAIKEIFPDNDITKVISWNLDNPADGHYITRIILAKVLSWKRNTTISHTAKAGSHYPGYLLKTSSLIPAG